MNSFVACSIFMEKFIKISGAGLAVLGTILLFLPKKWSHFVYYPTYLGIIFLVSAAVIFLPPMLFRKDTPQKKKVILKMQTFLAISVLMNAAGELGLFQLYTVGFEYDKFVHLTTGLLFSIVFGEMLMVWKKLNFRQIIWPVVLMVLAGGVAWKIWESASDILFHTQESGIYGQFITSDTFGDLLWGLLGIMYGLIFLKITSWNI